MPFWANPGSAAQDTIPTKSLEPSGRQAAAQTKTRQFGGLCHSASPVFGGCSGAGRVLLLQAYLPGWDAGGRHPAGSAEQVHAKRTWLAVCLEERTACHYHFSVHDHLPPFLQIYLSAGGNLLGIQSDFGVQVPGG